MEEYYQSIQPVPITLVHSSQLLHKTNRNKGGKDLLLVISFYGARLILEISNRNKGGKDLLSVQVEYFDNIPPYTGIVL